MDRIDIFTGTLGKAMGGAVGGFTTAKREVIELLRQRSRPYLFSNSLPPHVVAAGIKAFEMLSQAGDLREQLAENTRYFRERMTAAGFDIKPGVHPICPVMLYDAPLAQKFAQRLARGRHLRDRVLLPGRAQGPGAHPHADVAPRTRANSWTARSMPSSGSATNLAC